MTSINLDYKYGSTLLTNNMDSVKLEVIDNNGNEHTDVHYESDNSNVATVNQDGLVEAVSDGSCTITAHSNVDDSLQASIDITVDKSISFYMQSSLKDEYGLTEWKDDTGITEWGYYEFEPGTTLQIEIYKNKSQYSDIEYSVDNEHVATIDEDGILTFIGEGKVTVTVTDKADTRFNAKYKYKILNNVPIKDLVALPSTGISSIDVDGGQLQMITRERPSGQLYTDVTYSVDDESIVTIDAETGLLTAVGNGLVYVKITDKRGIIDAFIDTGIIIKNQVQTIYTHGVDDIDYINVDGGQLQMVTVSLTDNKPYTNVTYSVDDESIATIDAETGLLTAVGNGVVHVKATSKTKPNLISNRYIVDILNQK